MICPSCGRELSSVTVGALTVDACDGIGCGGIFFDHDELTSVDDLSEECGDELVRLQKRTNPVAVDSTEEQSRRCPKCAGIKMMRHYFSARQKVVIDECGKCHGIWLDAGELDQIRREFGSREERERDLQAYFEKLFPGNPARSKSKAAHVLERLFNFRSEKT